MKPAVTIAAALSASAAQLHATSDSPRLDAELLLEAVTGFGRSVAISFPEKLLTTEQQARFGALVDRRSTGEPLAYIVGQREFWSLSLAVTPDVLIPRPETELVVERALVHLPAEAKVLDLATGSGAIALAIASERPRAQVTGTDVSSGALRVALGNAQRLGLGQVRCAQGSWYEPVTGERFHLIASNPPYISAGDPDLEPGVRAHEPEIALISGATGMECLEHIVRYAPRHLEPGGWLVLEHGWQQAGLVRNLLEQAGFTHVRSHADLAGHERVTEGQFTRHSP